jgi:predicted transcriptional regulator of viral defense system
MQKPAALAIIERLAAENRRVLSDWRALLLLRRATLELPSGTRRWSRMPSDLADIYPVLRQMQHRGDIKPLLALRGIYEVTAPYAGAGLIDEYEVLMEVNPYGTVGYLSALVYHGLTDELPKDLTAIAPQRMPVDVLPPGTTVEEWEGLGRPLGRRPPRILERPVHWIRLRLERYFGTAEYHRQGYPVRVTDRERTLLDGLQEPDLSGGLQNVLRAWVAARDILDLDRLVYYADRLGVAVLRQRVGYVLDELELTHPAVEDWRRQARRGGSSKLLSSASYSPSGNTHFSETWNLSLNAPVTVLREGGA